MDFWENDDGYRPDRMEAAEEDLLNALTRSDETRAAEILDALEGPVSERGASFCLRGGLDHSLELFRQVLEHCGPDEYSESCTVGMGDGFIRVRGSMLLLAAMLDRPHHARLLLEHGYDCNGAGVGFDRNLQRMRTAYRDTVPPYAKYCGACGNRVELRNWEKRRNWSVSCATPLAAALLCGSFRTGKVLLDWPGIWKAESSAVCRAAVMVLEGIGDSVLSGERKAARMELLRQIFCPEQVHLPDQNTFLRTYHLQPVCWVDFCSVRTLGCQMESGLCGEEDARQMLELLSGDHEAEEHPLDPAGSGKLLLLKKYFPRLCRQPWAAGVFLREILRRRRNDRPCRTLLRAWKQLCGREWDLTWGGPYLWQLDRQALRQFLRDAGEGGTLVLDSDAVPPGYAPACLAELLDQVRFRRRNGAGISGLLQVMMETEDLRLLRRAAMRGVLAGEAPAVLLEYLMKAPGSHQHVRATVLAYAGKLPAAEGCGDWQDPRRWAFWKGWFGVEEVVFREDLDAVLHRKLSPEECLWRMFRIRQYQKQECATGEFSVSDSRYPALQTDSLCGVACCAEGGQAMALMMESLPRELLETVNVSWGWQLCFRGTLLALAAALGRTEQVRLLLENGLCPDETGRGDVSRFFVRRNFLEDGVPVTPLLAAILFGQEETARLLLDAGAVCDFSHPAHLRVLRQGSAASLDLAARLPGVGNIPERELEALRFAVSKGGARGAFWACLDAKKQ